jgi:hypothetical protein
MKRTPATEYALARLDVFIEELNQRHAFISALWQAYSDMASVELAIDCFVSDLEILLTVHEYRGMDASNDRQI